MLGDITWGQYFPGDTAIHRLDPRTKLILVTLYVIVLFSVRTLPALGLMAAFLMIVIWGAKAKLGFLLRGLRSMCVLLAVTGVLSVFTTPGEPIFHIWIFTATKAGFGQAAVLLARIGMMVVVSSILTYTTPPMELADGLEKSLSPLKRLRVPVHELAMIMSTALRFVPTLLEEANKIMRAQTARGADFETGNIIKRSRAMIPLLIPLFMSVIRRADELAIAMESRCYHGGEGRTRMRQLKFEKRDLQAAVAGAVLLISIIGLEVLNR